MQNHEKCNIMQGVKLCKVQNYANSKIMQSTKSWKVQNYAKWKIKQITKLWSYARFKSQQYPLKFIDTKETAMILVVLFRFYETGSVKPGSIGGTKPKVEMAISAN